MSSNRMTALTAISGIALLATSQIGCDGIEDREARLADDQPFQGIVGGQETGYDYFMGVVALYYSMGAAGGSICTGTVIDPNVVLSAGHCVYYPSEGIDAIENPQMLTIMGGSNLNSLATRIIYSSVDEVIVHPDWEGTTSSFSAVDLSLVKLASPIYETETYKIREDDDFGAGATGKIVGYGLSSSSAPTSAGIHREGDTTVQNKVMHYINLGDPAGTCQGDSGGPFFTMIEDEWHVTGVTSLGLSSTCDPMTGSVDVNVVQFRDWIDGVLQDWLGYGLDEVPHQDPPAVDGDSDSDSHTDTDSDSETDTDTDTVADATGGKDSGSCSAAAIGDGRRSLLALLP